jgi:hypothetical protein
MGLPKMRVARAVSSSNWQIGLVASPILWRCLLRQKCFRDKRNKIPELFFRETHVVFGCLQLWVFNPKLGLSTAVKCDPVFKVCVNDPLSIHIPDNRS